jgi:acetyltransferase-like isoleucine patch superfamily enzyme
MEERNSERETIVDTLSKKSESSFKKYQQLFVGAMEERNSERETIVDTLSKKSESSFKKYQQLFVGSDSIFDLLQYEFCTFFFGPVPGGLGFFLRRVFYKKIFEKIGNGTVIGPYVTLRYPKQISLGNTVLIDSNTVLDAKGSDSHIRLGNSVLIGKDSILSCTSATIKIGDDVSIGPYCHIRAGLSPIEMGSHVTIGSHTVVISGNPGYKLTDIPMKKQVGSTEGITIGNDVWIGVGVRKQSLLRAFRIMLLLQEFLLR